MSPTGPVYSVLFSLRASKINFNYFGIFYSTRVILLGCRVNITYVDRDGKEIAVRAKVGDNVMYLAHRYNIELEGESCLILVRKFYRP